MCNCGIWRQQVLIDIYLIRKSGYILFVKSYLTWNLVNLTWCFWSIDCVHCFRTRCVIWLDTFLRLIGKFYIETLLTVISNNHFQWRTYCNSKPDTDLIGKFVLVHADWVKPFINKFLTLSQNLCKLYYSDTAFYQIIKRVKPWSLNRIGSMVRWWNWHTF